MIATLSHNWGNEQCDKIHFGGFLVILTFFIFKCFHSTKKFQRQMFISKFMIYLFSSGCSSPNITTEQFALGFYTNAEKILPRHTGTVLEIDVGNVVSISKSRKHSQCFVILIKCYQNFSHKWEFHNIH